MWTTENRVHYQRGHLRYPSDTTDEGWTEMASLIPPARRDRRKRTVNIRAVLNGLLYVLSTGCQWRAIPKDFLPRRTIFDYFGRWEADGTLRRVYGAGSKPEVSAEPTWQSFGFIPNRKRAAVTCTALDTHPGLLCCELQR